MKNIDRPQEEQLHNKPTLQDLDSFPGREIAGIEPRPEKFMKLEEGEDYQVTEKSEKVKSDKDLGDFFVFISPSAGTETKVIEAPHWRVINSPDVRAEVEIPASEDGDSVRDYFYSVNTKGVGYLKVPAKGLNIEDYDSWMIMSDKSVEDKGYRVLGFVSAGENTRGNVMEKSEELVAQGLRSELYWGLAKLKRLPFKGRMMTVDELKKNGVISPEDDFEPGQAVRLLKTNTRIAEVSDSDRQRSLELFGQAFEVFNKETADKKLELSEIKIGDSDKERVFFLEFFRRMGHNMAILLNMGYAHGAMHSSNVTLAAELGDVGTISHWSEEDQKRKIKKYGGVRRENLKDMRDMCYDLRILLKAARNAGLNAGDLNDLRNAFFEGFEGAFDAKSVKSEKSDPEKAKLWMEKIFDTVVIEGENLPSLLHNEIEDWDIIVK